MFELRTYRRILVILIFLPLFSITSYAQNNTELITDFLQTKQSNEKRLASLMDVEWSELKVRRDSFNVLLNKGISLSKILKMDKEMYNFILVHTEYVGDFSDERMEQLDNIINTSKAKGWDELQIRGHYWKGRGLGMRNEIPKAIKVLTELINRKDKLIEKYYKIHAMTYEELAILSNGNGDKEKTLEMYKQSYEINKKNKDSIGMCANLNNIGGVYLFTPNFERFRYYANKSLALAFQLKHKDFMYLSYLNYANKFGFNEMYDSCLVYALKAEQITKESKNKSKEGQIADIIAACYLNLDQLPKSLSYQLRAYELCTEAYSKNKIALNVGLVYIAMKNYKKASEYYNIALDLANKTEYGIEIANVLNHKGYLNLEQKKYKRALTNFNLASDKLSQIENEYIKNETYRGLAITNQKLGNNKISNDYVTKALASQNNFTQLSKLYLTQANNFEQLGNFELAYKAQQNYSRYKDSLTTKSNKKLEHTILAKYSVEKAENQARLATMDKEVADLNTQKQKRMKLFGFLLLGLSLISIFVIISRHKKFITARDKARKLEKEQAQAIIDQSRNVLESQSDLILNKNRLIDELKNNLNTLFKDASVDVDGMNSFLDTKILTKEDWKKFKTAFTVVYPSFIEKSSTLYPNLTASELRLLCLQKLGMSPQESADMLGVLHDSVKRTTHRLFQKFDIDSSLSLQEVVDRIG